jgi:hypothetical protein
MDLHDNGEFVLLADYEALERELAAESATLQEEFRENHRRADKIVALRARVAELVDAKPSAQTKAECDCPSLHGGRCMYPDCSQAASANVGDERYANP